MILYNLVILSTATFVFLSMIIFMPLFSSPSNPKPPGEIGSSDKGTNETIKGKTGGSKDDISIFYLNKDGVEVEKKLTPKEYEQYEKDLAAGKYDNYVPEE